jgi:hypothetical protein
MFVDVDFEPSPSEAAAATAPTWSTTGARSELGSSHIIEQQIGMEGDQNFSIIITS